MALILERIKALPEQDTLPSLNMQLPKCSILPNVQSAHVNELISLTCTLANGEMVNIKQIYMNLELFITLGCYGKKRGFLVS